MLELLNSRGMMERGDGYRFIRIEIFAGSGYSTIDEIEVVDSVTGKNWSREPGVKVSANSIYPGYSHEALIDGITGLELKTATVQYFWAALSPVSPTVSNPNWVELDLGKNRIIDLIRIMCPIDYTRYLTHFHIKASNDGEEYVTLHTEIALTSWQHGVFKEFHV